MNIKKLTLLLLSASLLAGFFTACGKKSDSEKAQDAIQDAADGMKDALK